MQQYYVEEPLEEGKIIQLPKDKAHHAFRVLKLQHETVRLVSNGTGWFAEVYQEGGNGMARILSADPDLNELHTDITLCMALIRREKFELVLQKAAELGVKKIIPFESSRCVVKAKNEKTARWNAILLEACEQCKRTLVPECLAPVPIKDLSSFKSTVNLCAYENAGSQASFIHESLPADSVTIVIGPEGGFSKEEVQLLSDAGFSPVTLGSRILRAETAAFYACSVIGEISG
ncbi:MAG: 16S rRNA (uracil(1498)-N(3))-methyltransferase [Solobacterium sp.]|nr:16S rRNA (uracil(1498)-N(3))-methyltransferase [Solobacterium sp.]